MCQSVEVKFFRPWDDVFESEEDSSTIEETMDSRMNLGLEESRSNRVELSRSASTSSSSAISEDLPENNDVNMPNNFEFSTQPENHIRLASAEMYDPYNPGYNNPHRNQFMAIAGPSNEELPTIVPEVEAIAKYVRRHAAIRKMVQVGPKGFACRVCSLPFRNIGQLTGHIRAHSVKRPFKCKAKGCIKAFTRNEELTRHKRIHSVCLVCRKRFARKDHLEKHTRTHAPGALFRLIRRPIR